MTNSAKSVATKPTVILSEEKFRNIYKFTEVDNFYFMLQDRIHSVIDRFFLNKRFTVIINAFPRRERIPPVERNKPEAVGILEYVGVRRQQSLLNSYEETCDFTISIFICLA